jgi:AcrR family transcriptional regulator
VPRKAPRTAKQKVLTKAKKTRFAIVERAMGIAAAEGLAALTIGRLAKELRMSKSGLFVHFGSKEKLEAAVIARAADIFSGHVLEPAEDNVEHGIARVWTLCEYWLQFVDRQTLPGGYFFTGAFFVHARQDSSVSRQVREVVGEWLKALRLAVDEARHRQEIRMPVDAKRTAFELNSLLIGAQWSLLLDHLDHSHAHSAILAKLKSLATKRIPTDAFDSEAAWHHYLETMPTSRSLR